MYTDWDKEDIVRIIRLKFLMFNIPGSCSIDWATRGSTDTRRSKKLRILRLKLLTFNILTRTRSTVSNVKAKVFNVFNIQY